MSEPPPLAPASLAFQIGPLFDLTHEAVLAADLQSESVIMWNPAATQLFGYSLDEALGMPLDALVPGEMKDLHHRGTARFRAGGEAVLVGGPAVEVPAITKSGARLIVALTLTEVPTGEFRRFVVAIIRDVTAQRDAEDELRRANTAMRDFVAAASHDLRSPLSSVLGFATLIRDRRDELSADAIGDYASAILRAGTQASRLVDDLLTVSKIDAGMIETRPEVLSVSEIAGQAASDIDAGIIIDISGALRMHADPDHVLRIVRNLLGNATKHGQAPVTISATRDGATIVLRVDDCGPQVPESFRVRLFEKFARGPGVRDEEGSGLGLSIVAGLARANAGEAFFVPTATGNAFGVRFPAAE